MRMVFVLFHRNLVFPIFSMPGDIFSDINLFLNGPIMCAIFIIGLTLNLVTLYILCGSRAPSRQNSTKLNTKQAEPILNRALLSASSDIWQRRMSSEQKKKMATNKRPKIYIYLLWLTGCDAVLLLVAFMNFSVPAMFDCLTSMYTLVVPAM